MFVDVNHHKNGIGRKIMNFAEKIIKKNGYNELIVPSTITAYEFYEKWGHEKYSSEFYDVIGEVKLLKKYL